eukprot:jgi/Botrbrau1/4445/Bobra.0348s0033.1
MGLTAVLVKYTFPYSWTWVECLLFGAMFSATDPVAVVAVLREAGLSKKLRTLVDSEALLNDGSAYVLFFLLKAWAEGAHQTAGDAVVTFCQLTLGGPTAGLVFAICTTLWLRQMYNNEMGEIVLTIVAAFGTYLVSDQLLHVSGVLAVVVLGTWMSAAGANHISRSVIHPLHIVWETLEYVANTLIFILSGVIIAAKIYTNSVGNADEIVGIDYGYAVLLWVYLLIIRALLFVIFWPALKNLGYGLDWKQALVLSWSGLRGAVGLSLSLFVLLDGKISDVRFRTQAFFHMGAVAFLTLMIQGSTMGLLLTALGMTKPASIKRGFLRHLLRKTEAEGDDQLNFAAKDRVLGDPDWKQVRQLSSLDHHAVLKKYMSRLNMSNRRHSQQLPGVSNEVMALKMNRSNLLAEKRTRYLTAVRRTYEDFFHDAYITSSQVYYLRDSADRALDEVNRPLRDWHFLRQHCNLRWWVRWLQRYQRFDWLADPLHNLLLEDLRTRATIALAFCHAHEITAADLLQHEGLGTIEEWTEEQSAFSFDIDFTILHQDMKHNVTMQVVAESRGQLALAQRLLAQIKEAYPEVLRSIKTTQLAQELLLYKEELLKEIGETGLIEDSELEQMQGLVEKKLKHLHFHPPRSTSLHPASLLARHPMFADVPPTEFTKQVLRPAALRVYEEGDALNSAGKDADAVVVILRGSARLIAGDPELKRRNVQPFIASAGAVLFCWPALLQVAQPFQGLAATVMLVYRIPLATFRQLMSKYKSVSDGAWQACGAALAHAHGGPMLASRTFNQLCALFREAGVEALKEGATLRIAGTAFLVYGSIRRMDKDSKEDVTARYQGPCLLPSHPENYTCLDKVKVLHLPPEYDDPDLGDPDDKPGKGYSVNGGGDEEAPFIFAGEGDSHVSGSSSRDLERAVTMVTLGHTRAIRTERDAEHLFRTRSLSPRHQGLGHRHSFELPKVSPFASESPTEKELGQTWSTSSMGGDAYPAHAATLTPTAGKALAEEVNKALHPSHGATVSGAEGKSLAKELQTELAGNQAAAARARGRRAGLTGWAMSGGLEAHQGSVGFEDSLFSKGSGLKATSSVASPRSPASPEEPPRAIRSPRSPSDAGSPPHRSRVARIVSAFDHGLPVVAGDASQPDAQITAAGLEVSEAIPEPGTAARPEPSGASATKDALPGRQESSGLEGSVGKRVKRVSIAPTGDEGTSTHDGAPKLRRQSTGFRSTLQRNSTLSRSRYAIAQAMLQEDLKSIEDDL